MEASAQHLGRTVDAHFAEGRWTGTAERAGHANRSESSRTGTLPAWFAPPSISG
jgi:hypothetical protein